MKDELIKRGLRKIAKLAAKRDASTACACITYQPIIPESVKKLKRRK